MQEIILGRRRLERDDVRYFLVEMNGRQSHAEDAKFAFHSIKLYSKLFVEHLEKEHVFYVGDVHLSVEKQGDIHFSLSEYNVSVKTYFAVPFYISDAEIKNIFQKVGKKYDLKVGTVETFIRPKSFSRSEDKTHINSDSNISSSDKEKVEALLDHVFKVYRIDILQRKIDIALDERDKETFQRLSEEYVLLKGITRN